MLLVGSTAYRRDGGGLGPPIRWVNPLVGWVNPHTGWIYPVVG